MTIRSTWRMDSKSAVHRTSFKPHAQPKLRAATLIILATILLAALLFSLFFLPHITSYLITTRYPQCGHIVLVSTQRHGSTWFISNAEGCTSKEGSYGRLNRYVEIWNYGRVKDIKLQSAIDLVRFNTSVKVFPGAVYNHRENVMQFFKAMIGMQVPVFVLRRRLDQSFASKVAAKENKLWNADNRGEVVERQLATLKRFPSYVNETETFFNDVKALMRAVGVVWDTVQYEEIVSQRIILGENSRCYIRNCNFD